MFIEDEEGFLYRGPHRGLPREKWDDDEKKFVPYAGGPKPEGWGREVNAERALKLMNV